MRTQTTTTHPIHLRIAVLLIALVAALAGCSAAFNIEGSWQVTQTTGFGQAQQGAIITFNGQNANLYSPQDTYAVQTNNGTTQLTVTGMLGGTSTFDVTITDNNNITLSAGTTKIVLKRAG